MYFITFSCWLAPGTREDISIKYSGLSCQYFWANYATVKSGERTWGQHFFFPAKRHQRQSTFFHWILPHSFSLMLVPGEMFFSWDWLFPISWGERQHVLSWLGSNTLHPLAEPWPCWAAVLSWISTIKMGSKPYRMEPSYFKGVMRLFSSCHFSWTSRPCLQGLFIPHHISWSNSLCLQQNVISLGNRRQNEKLTVYGEKYCGFYLHFNPPRSQTMAHVTRRLSQEL